MRTYKTSRVLNDEAAFMGLSYMDITGAGIFLLSLMMLGKAVGIQSMLWALVMVITALCLLIPIRMNFRRKIIRDAFLYVFKKGTNHVSKNPRISRN